MRLEEFKSRVVQAFGRDLEKATPANVREFIDATQQALWREERADSSGLGEAGVIDISGTPLLTYEAIMRRFFARALAADDEQALLQLWLLALDLAYSGIEESQAERLNALFSETPGD